MLPTIIIWPDALAHQLANQRSINTMTADDHEIGGPKVRGEYLYGAAESRISVC
jgi:hypothetical protein